MKQQRKKASFGVMFVVLMKIHMTSSRQKKENVSWRIVMSKYLKLLAVVEGEDYEPITGKITAEGNVWDCEHVMGIKLTEDFTFIDDVEFWSEAAVFLKCVLAIAEERSNE
jgi:hypothetical protein